MVVGATRDQDGLIGQGKDTSKEIRSQLNAKDMNMMQFLAAK